MKDNRMSNTSGKVMSCSWQQTESEIRHDTNHVVLLIWHISQSLSDEGEVLNLKLEA